MVQQFPNTVADSTTTAALDKVDAMAEHPCLVAVRKAQKDVQDVVVLCCGRGEDLRDKCAVRARCCAAFGRELGHGADSLGYERCRREGNIERYLQILRDIDRY